MYKVSYLIEYADGTHGHGSHGEFKTRDEALEEVERMRNRKYDFFELEYAPMYYSFTIVPLDIENN